MINRDAELSYYDNGYKSVTVTRNRYGRLKDFYKAIESLMKSIFITSEVNHIEIYYNQYHNSILYSRDEVMSKDFIIKRINIKRGYYK